MNWIERIFGFSPDAGDGSMEIALSLSILATAAIVVVCKRLAALQRLRRGQ